MPVQKKKYLGDFIDTKRIDIRYLTCVTRDIQACCLLDFTAENVNDTVLWSSPYVLTTRASVDDSNGYDLERYYLMLLHVMPYHIVFSRAAQMFSRTILSRYVGR